MRAAFAARGLGAMKDPRAVEPLLAAATKDPRPAVRFRAVEALGRLGDPARGGAAAWRCSTRGRSTRRCGSRS